MGTMDALSEAHLLKLSSYLTKHLYDRRGVRAIRNDVLNKYVGAKSSSCVNVEKMCPFCFTFWSEGEFTIKFKPKKTPRKQSGKPVKKTWVMKCLICFKRVAFKCTKAKDPYSSLKLKDPRARISKSSRNVRNSKSQFQNNRSGVLKKKRGKNSGAVVLPQNKSKSKETQKTALSMLHDLL